MFDFHSIICSLIIRLVLYAPFHLSTVLLFLPLREVCFPLSEKELIKFNMIAALYLGVLSKMYSHTPLALYQEAASICIYIA